MAMAAAAWDVLEKAANMAQMLAMLVAGFTCLQRVQESNKRQCAKLERCTRRLRSLLQWPAMDDIAVLLLCSETRDPFGKVLGDAAGLVETYKKSTLWRRVRSGGRMATQLRNMQDVVDSYCDLLLFVNAHLLLHPQSVQHHQTIPPSSDTTTIPEVNDTAQSPSAQAGASCPAVAVTRGTERAKDVGQGGMDNEPAGCKRNVSALLPIVISHP